MAKADNFRDNFKKHIVLQLLAHAFSFLVGFIGSFV